MQSVAWTFRNQGSYGVCNATVPVAAKAQTATAAAVASSNRRLGLGLRMSSEKPLISWSSVGISCYRGLKH